MPASQFYRDSRDARFILWEHLDAARLLKYPAFSRFSRESLDQELEEALGLAREVLAPSLQEGDRQGCRWEAGRVSLPQSFYQGWRTMAQRGWSAPSCDPDFGGRGLPQVVGALATDFFFGANLALALYPNVAAGNGRLIESFGTDQDRALFVRPMYTGRWGGTMCLSEPEVGSDVGWLKTSARPYPEAQDPRLYRIKGLKRFITTGEQDCTENIIHLVLARIEGSPQGSQGLSLFIAPKIWVEPDGSLGESNDVYCIGIEPKMGLHGSGTCRLQFGRQEACRGILLGRPQSGLAQMFQMMNESRLATGLMGLALAGAAFGQARRWAGVRVQGRPFGQRGGERVRLIEHEDVRRMLMNLKAGSEAMRAMAARVYLYWDQAGHDPDPAVRARAQARLDFFTPVVKACCSDLSFLLIREAIQILGGTGYCSALPVEQHARDCKVTSIWEGTSYIQARDLIGRKLARDGGRTLSQWLEEVQAAVGRGLSDPDFGPDFKLLGQAAGAVGRIAAGYTTYLQNDKLRLVPLSATRFQESLGEVLMAQLLLEQGLAARRGLDRVEAASEEGLFYRGKIASAQYFCRNILTNVWARQASLELEDTSALDLPENAF